MAVSKLPLSPYRQDTRVFPTPLSSDVLFSELRDCTRSEIPAYGTAHPDSRKWPDHKLVFVKQVGADQREGLFEFYYAADRANQDLYNFSTGFDNIGGRAGDRNFRIITRVYLTPRAEYNPVDIPFGTAMPDAPKGMFEVGEYIYFDKQQQKADIEELNSLYVIEAHRYIEKAVIEEITSFDKERSDVIPEKFRVGYPTLRTDRIVEGIAEEPTLDSNDLAVSEKQVNPDVKLVTNVSRDGLTDTITLSGSRAYAESTDASVTETLTTDGSIEKGLFVIESQSTPLGDGNFVVQTVKVDSWPELRQSQWDPLLNTPVVTTQTFVAPPTDSDLNTPFTSFSPVNEDRYLKTTEETPAAGLANYKFTFPTRINVDMPPVLRQVGVIWSIDSSAGSSTSTSTGDSVSESKISVSRGKSTSNSGSSGATPEFVVDIQRIWGRDVKADNHVFFIDKSSENLSQVTFSEEEIISQIQNRFYKPSIVSFNAAPSSIISGNSTVLTWNTEGASGVTLNGSPVTLSGTQTVSPTVDTEYTLVASNQNGSTTTVVRLEVVSAGSSTLISKFDVSKSYVEPDTNVVLEWQVSVNGVRFNNPQGVVVDSNGDVFIADFNNHVIRKTTALTNVVTTFAGTAGQSGHTDGTGSAARFYFPRRLAIDSSDNIYVVDNFCAVRKITSAGVVTTLAGSAENKGTANGTGSAARFGGRMGGIAVADNGDVFVCDTYNHTIRKITSAGVVTTFAGVAGVAGTANGTLAAARFRYPATIAVGSGANPTIYVAGNYTVRKIAYGGGSYSVTRLTGMEGITGHIDGNSTTARLAGTFGGIVIHPSTGDLYLTQIGSAIRKITSSGDVTSPYGIQDQQGIIDGTGTAARFYFPTGLFFKSIGGTDYVIVCDSGNHIMRHIDLSTGNVVFFAGTKGAGVGQSLIGYGYSDGSGQDYFEARIETPNDPSFIFLPKNDQSRQLFLQYGFGLIQKNYWLRKSGNLTVMVSKTTDFVLSVTNSAGVTETRNIRVSVSEFLADDQFALKPWPVFKTSSGRAVGVAKSSSKSTADGEQKTDAVSEDSIYQSREKSRSFSYSTSTRVSVTEISNVLTSGVFIQSSKSVSPVSSFSGLSPANAATVTHRQAAGPAGTASCQISPSSPTNIPRGGRYLIDYKIEYYKWGWFRCAATVINASQFK
jgi:hypothetical protein